MNYENLYYMLILVMLGVGIWKTLENMKLRKDLHRERKNANAYEQSSIRLLVRINQYKVLNRDLRVKNEELLERLYKSQDKNKEVRSENYYLKKNIELIRSSETIGIIKDFQVQQDNPIQ